MIDIAIAIDECSVPVTHKIRSQGAYDINGNLVPGTQTSKTIHAAMQPAKGRHLEDMPEGIRAEAKWLIWSRVGLALDEEIESQGKTYRIVYVWPRVEGGFTRAAMGLKNDG